MNGQVLDPDSPEQKYQQACLLVQQGKMDEAALVFQQCLRIKPDHVEALINLGFIRGEQGKHDEALEINRRALLFKPPYPELFVNMGNALREKKRYDEAAAYFKEAIRLKPDHAKAYLNLGICLSDQWKHDEACAYFRQAIQLQPTCFEAYNNLGAAVSLEAERLDEAISLYRECLKYKPDFAEAHWNLALALLLEGNFEQGWKEFEWRWQCKNTQPLTPVTQPRWDGSPLEGKSILLHWEQGLGDTLHFIRYARLVKERGGKVLVYCQKSLPKILSRCAGIDELIANGSPLPDYHVYVPLLSLPLLFGTTLAAIPAQVPYILPDPELVEHWRSRLSAVRSFRVGIVWAGNPNHPWDRQRSLPLSSFEPLARIEGVQLISLQKGPGTEQLTALAGRFPVTSLENVDETTGGFMDSAAILCNLDLLVSSDTAMAHLAGALGVPVWLALPAIPDWRWLLHRDDSPWYPTMRLFRQRTRGDWPEVFGRVAAELKRSLAGTAVLGSQPRPSSSELTFRADSGAPKSYDIKEHRHRFSVWAAARAAQRGFADVGTLRRALEGCGIVEYLHAANFDEIDAARFDKLHRQWCTTVVDFLEKAGIPNVTFGRAAKLVAMYLKSVVVLGPGCGSALARVAHPPLDGITLRNLAASDVNSEHKSKWAHTNWIRLNDEQYYELISQLRQALGSEMPFWKLERFWTVTSDAALP